MRWTTVGIVIFAGVLVWLGYRQYQDPRIQEILSPPSNPVPRAPRPPVKLSRPEPSNERPRVRQTVPAGRPEADSRSPAQTADTLPNRQLTSTILGILRAKGLSDGVSLSVTDQLVTVQGQVDSEKTRKDILYVLENSRGARGLDATGLLVGSDQP